MYDSTDEDYVMTALLSSGDPGEKAAEVKAKAVEKATEEAEKAAEEAEKAAEKSAEVDSDDKDLARPQGVCS